jgi:hypothetical protein
MNGFCFSVVESHKYPEVSGDAVSPWVSSPTRPSGEVAAQMLELLELAGGHEHLGVQG